MQIRSCPLVIDKAKGPSDHSVSLDAPPLQRCRRPAWHHNWLDQSPSWSEESSGEEEPQEHETSHLQPGLSAGKRVAKKVAQYCREPTPILYRTVKPKCSGGVLLTVFVWMLAQSQACIPWGARETPAHMHTTQRVSMLPRKYLQSLRSYLRYKMPQGRAESTTTSMMRRPTAEGPFADHHSCQREPWDHAVKGQFPLLKPPIPSLPQPKPPLPSWFTATPETATITSRLTKTTTVGSKIGLIITNLISGTNTTLLQDFGNANNA